MIKMRFETVSDRLVCVLDVTQSPMPAYLKTEKGLEFFIRFGPTSRALDLSEAIAYVNMHWNS